MIRSTVPGLVAGALCALAFSPFASAQVAPGSPVIDGPTSPQLDAFFVRHGDGWKVAQDVVAGRPMFVWGQRIAHPGSTPRTAIEFESAARSAVDTNTDVFGFDSTELQLREVRFLDLARVQTSDKVAVVFDQVVDGIPVLAGSVSVLFERATGDVIALDTTGIPGAGAVDLIPSGSLDAAIVAAYAAYEAKFGVPALSVDDVDMGVMGSSIIWPRKSPIQERAPALVYVLSLSSKGFLSNQDVPAQARVYVSAEGDATVFHVEATAHAAISGGVTGNTNIGGETNTAINQETVNLPFMHVRNGTAAGAILATTDESGAFTMAQNGPVNLFFELRGPFANVNNGQGADASFIVNASSAASVSVLFNPLKTEFTSGEMAAYHWVNQFRLWIKGVSPSDTTMDFQVVADVNQNVVAGISTCNAVYVGNAIQFLKTGGGCQNTSYRPVVTHEEGHWANEKYQGASGISGAFHEGNADAWAYTMTDSPCLDSFSGSGCLRSALQTSVKKCASDGSESCNGGEGHTEGQAIASAIWKVRDNLNVSLGNAAGDAVHDGLFLGWMQSFNDKVILNVIQDHWLALDDDDANIGNGSPHFQEITTGFKAYNWPTISLPDLAITNVVGPAGNASLSPFQGNLITATITSILGSVATAEVRYSVNNSAFVNLAMSPTGNPNEWSALIPGQANQSTVRWYVHATGTAAGSTLDSPAAGASAANVYFHGQFVQLAFFNFEHPSSDEGWTHVSLSGSNGDQWQRNNPANSEEATDPTAAFSGTRVWGTDLSATGTDGEYEQNSSGELRSPMFNFTGSSKVILQFRRWLAVEEGQFDQASVRVNGTQVFVNPNSGDLIDTSWVLQEIDITSLAANNPAVQIAFRLAADGGVQFGGWNIDDVLLYRIDPAPAGFFSAYGSGCPGTGGLVPSLQGAGVPAAGNAITINVTNGKPNVNGTLLLATAQGNASLGSGCSLLLGGVIFPSAIVLPLNGAGAISLPALLPPGTPSVDLFMQFFPSDTGSANGQYSASNGLQMHIQ